MGVHAPLSLAQQRLWFLYQLDPQSPEYNISRAWRLKGLLHTEALVTSLNLILARHETLRTIFQEIDGQPIQVIQPTLTAPFQERDCSSYSPAQLEAEIDRFLIDEPRQPFDLLAGPLLRFTLIQCSSDDHVLVFTVHHMVCDGTSLKNFCQELSRYYAATMAGQPNPLTPLPIQYQDYAYWQQTQVTDEKLASQLAFWKQQLKEAPLVLELPSDCARPKDNSGPGKYMAFTLPPQAISNLKQLIQPQGITMFMALLAVFQILLFRYTGQRDILVGTPIAGRTHTDLEDLIGFLVNTLVLRIQIVGQPTFLEVLRQVRKTCLEAYRHQDLPFENLVEVLKPVRDPDRYPVIQAIFQFRQLSDLCLTFPEIEAHPFPVKNRTGNFDLHMVCEETESGIEGFLYYPQNLFSDTTMAGFTEHYQLLLEGLIANPKRPVTQISFLTDAEYHQQLIDWIDTTTAYPKDANLPDLFETQVTKTPEAVAVVWGEEQLTYGQLNARANQLAQYLRRQGVRPEVRVGVCLERGLDLIVSLLAIMKAGGAYVPLDPSYPTDRLGYMIEDAGICLLVTTAALQTKLPACPGQVICVDTDWADIHQESERNLNSGATPENVAYVIYTSGSTGHPKGVLVSHYNVVRLFQSTHDFFHVTAQDVWTFFHSFAFDFSVWEIWGAFFSGGRLVIVPYLVSRSPEEFYAVLLREQVTVLSQTPSSFKQLIQVEDSGELKHTLALRYIILAGETLAMHDLDPWYARHGDTGPQLINMYGITETTVHVTAQALTNNMLSSRSVIGRPLADLHVYVLDKYKHLLPIGVTGELYVGGAGLARGYLHRPDLTAERFIPDPFGLHEGTRLYRTGDLARLHSDGTLEYLGRLDQQVKLRGFRIELGEIENVLAQHPAIQNAVVLCREETPGENQLVAYVVPIPEAPLNPPLLRSYLLTRLPDYMVPAAFVILEALPLTPNGKVNRRALPPPEQAHRVCGGGEMAPRNQLEELLATIWGDLLKVDKIGIHDNFFALGGHSLLATQVMARLRQVLEFDLPLRTLFEHPTIAQLTREIDTLLFQAFPDWHKDKPAPEWRQMGRTETVVIPHTDTERKLADIWCQLLGLERVSLHDHFFSLGGHSLLAMRLTTRIRLVFGAELPISQIFEAPTFGELAKRIEALLVGGEPLSPLTEQVMEATAPASYAQERMWFLQQSMSNSAVYNTSFAFRILGDLQVEALRRSLQVLEERHDPLRTTFVLLGDQVGQHVQPAREFLLPLEDLSPMSSVAREDGWQAMASQEASQLFDLSKGPLWRGRLVRLSATEHVLLLTFHHICMDEWSLRIFREELSELYAGFAVGKTIALPPLPYRYVDYAQWQRQWLASSVADNQLEYWRTKLGRELSVLNLPTDYPRLSAPNERGATERRLFSSSLLEQLKKLSTEQEMTLFMTLLGAFQVLLSRYSGQDDIVVGTPIANRDLSKFQGLVGLFLNTMVMRSDLSGQPTFRETLTRVRKMALEAYANRNIPYEKVVQAIRGLQDGSTSPLFQVMFVLQNLEEHVMPLGLLETTLLPVSTGTAKFDLTLFLAANPEGLQAVMEYRTDLFEPTTIQQMLGNLEVLLEGIVSDPEKRIGELPLLAESERHQALVEWNQTTMDFPRTACIHQLFEAQAGRTPDAVAMVFEDCHVTYRELNCRANRLASHLQALGVEPEVPVGVCLERGVDLIVSLLAILKAGGAYVPLDPELPTERLAFMVQDVKPAVVLTRQGLVDDLDGPLWQTVWLNETLARAEEGHNPFCLSTPGQLAYLLFTSGSTGQPKAVAVHHQTLVNLVTWQHFQSGCGAGDRTLQFSALSFDVSLQEIFTALCGGGTLVLMDEETRRDLPTLVRRICEHRVTRLFLPFVLLEDLMHTFMALDVPPTWLREIVTAGEQLRITSSVIQLFERLSHTILVNQYGPTEAHVVSHYALSGSPSEWMVLPPIGRPIWNMQLYIFDETLHPVPIGVQGELYIGGEGLARGYWNRPELTALKFMPHPFDHQPGTRLYRTGDWARYRPDGNIEFLGRRDAQVKFRGYRIELGEIEATLEQHESVRQAIVVARETATGHKHLVAYVIPAKAEPSSSGELREALAARLPDYMIPAAFVVLEQFPLTPNGKVDRCGLPAPQQIDRGQPRAYESPRTPLESILVELWTDLLKIDDIGVHANFFALGGHSLLATRVVVRLRTMLDLDLPVRTLFERPTVAEFAMAIDSYLGATFPDWPRDDSLTSFGPPTS